MLLHKKAINKDSLIIWSAEPADRHRRTFSLGFTISHEGGVWND